MLPRNGRNPKLLLQAEFVNDFEHFFALDGVK